MAWFISQDLAVLDWEGRDEREELEDRMSVNF